MSRHYEYHRKQNLWRKHRYSSGGRDRAWLIAMLAVGGLVTVFLIWLNIRSG